MLPPGNAYNPKMWSAHDEIYCSLKLFKPNFDQMFGQVFGQGFDQCFGEGKNLKYSVEYYPVLGKHLKNHETYVKTI